MIPDTPPAGFIPPEHREFVYEDLSHNPELVRDIIATTGVYENGQFRRLTSEEVCRRCRKVIGVKDTRDGSVHGQHSRTPFVSWTVGDE